VGHGDPRQSANSVEAPFEESLGGYRLPGWHRGLPWAWYRRATPIITGDVFDPTVSYFQAETITYD
jgi:hypothetical protein